MAKAVQLKMLESGVALLTLDLPDSRYNLLSEQMMRDLNDALDEAKAQRPKGMVITSGKADNFVFGANVEEIQALQSRPAIEAYEASKLGKAIFEKIEKMPFRVVVAINGICLGGGTEMSLACHFRVATNNSKTQIGLPEVKLGFIPGWGGTVRLPRLIGLQQALPLILTGATVEPPKAWRLGLIDEVVEAHDLLDRAEKIALGAQPKRYKAPIKVRLASRLAGTGLGRIIVGKVALKGVMAQTKGKFPAPIEGLKVALKSLSGSREAAFEAESRAFARLAVTPTSRYLVGIFFADTQSKKGFGVKPSVEVKTVGVLGAGVMGAGIAQSAAYAGYDVVLKDINQDALDAGMKTIRGLFDSLVEKRKLSRTEADLMIASVKPTLKYEDMADCDLVIEAVVEVMKVKKIVLAELDKVIKKPYIFATNTSSLSVTEMSTGAAHPETVVGLHFFNPVYKMKLVEVVRGDNSAAEAGQAAHNFAQKLGKTTVITGDRAGFVVNAILTAYMREAVVMAQEGVSFEEIDKAMKSFGMPMGPMALLDEVGLDIAGHVINTLNGAFGERLAPPTILARVHEMKLLGKKGGKGIYVYGEDGKPTGVNPDIQALVTAKPITKQRGEIQDRLVLVMVNEAVRCLESGVITDPGQLDLAMIFGTGFPPFLGGPIRYIDHVGVRVIAQKLEMLSHLYGENYRPAAMLVEKARKGENFYAK